MLSARFPTPAWRGRAQVVRAGPLIGPLGPPPVVRGAEVEKVEVAVAAATKAPSRFGEAKAAPVLGVVELARLDVEQFYGALENGDIVSARINREKKEVYYVVAGEASGKRATVPITMGLIDQMIERGVMVTFEGGAGIEAVGQFVLQNIFTIVFIGLFVYSILMQRGAMSRGVRGVLGEKKSVNPEEINVKFADVAGLESAKQELMEVVDFLKSPERFAALGAKIPKGALLTGGPGLGKTLLAKAVAGEAGVPFFACSASEFIELFVGVGASRVRELFKKANEVAPCIIFIDEIDAIGRSRAGAGGMTGGNDERDQTINQLLTEMDGFNANKGIVVMAATNRPDILDKALVRPGRFDRQIALEAPTLADREKILGIHCQGKPLAEGVDLGAIARVTVGLSGAELANVANEAAILAARRKATVVAQEDFLAAIDRVLLGPERNSLISERKKRVVAAHEAGHTLVAMKVGEYDSISKVSIIPRGKAGGVTMFESDPENAESGLFSRKYLENRLVVALGGRAAEEVVFGEANVTTGAVNDMEVVQQLARAMVVNYGFSDKMGPASWANSGQGDYSFLTTNQADKEVMGIVKASYKKAKNIIENNMGLFTEIAEGLYKREVLTRQELEVIAKRF